MIYFIFSSIPNFLGLADQVSPGCVTTRTQARAVISLRNKDPFGGRGPRVLDVAFPRTGGKPVPPEARCTRQGNGFSKGKNARLKEGRREGAMYRSVTESRQNRNEKRKAVYWLEGILFASAVLVGVVFLFGLSV